MTENGRKDFDIIGMGEPLFEFNRATTDGVWQEGLGGDTSNAMVAAARAGARCGYVTALGADMFGRAFQELWRDEGIDASTVRLNGQASTGVYFITHGAAGHEFAYLRAGSAASAMTAADVPHDYLRRTRALHVSGISQAISTGAADAVFSAIECVKQAGGQVSYDTNLRLKLWPLDRARAVTHAAMRMCDIALPGLDDARQLTGLDDADAIADFYLTLGASVVALTLGKAGSMVATADRRLRIPSLPVQAVDATGAGDTFDGNFLAEYLATGDAFGAGLFATVAAALSTTGYGAVAPMPNRAAVLDAIARSGR